MSPLERRSLKIGTILLLVLWVLALAHVTVDYGGPVKGNAADGIGVLAIVLSITTGLIYIGRIVAYAKLMGAGNIRNKALVLLILSIVTSVFILVGPWLFNELSGDSVHSALGAMLLVRILGMISAIVLIKMLVQAADEAGGSCPGWCPAPMLGLSS